MWNSATPVDGVLTGQLGKSFANAQTRPVNGIMQHTVMPTLVELRAAQKKDAGIMLVRKFVSRYARTDMDEIDVKDQKQKNIARNELPEEHRKQAGYFHLSNGVLMYRDMG